MAPQFTHKDLSEAELTCSEKAIRDAHDAYSKSKLSYSKEKMISSLTDYAVQQCLSKESSDK